MRLSAGKRVNVSAVNYSFCGKYLAYACQNNLFIIGTANQNVIRRYQCIDTINSVEWSVDCDHILCALYKRLTVQVFSLIDPEWFCRVQEGTSGLQSASWSPTGYHILTVAEFSVKISIWSLVGRSVASVDNPIMKKDDRLFFSPNGKYWAVIKGEMENYKIVIFSTSSWQPQIEMQCSNDIKIPSNAVWSPNSAYIAVWETLDVRSQMLEVYSTTLGVKVAAFKSSQRTDLCGIHSVAWSPSSQFLLFGCYDDCIYILNYITWTVVHKMTHSEIINPGCQVFKEIGFVYEEITERPLTVSSSKVAVLKLPRNNSIDFSHNGQYVATQSHRMPNVIWLWQLETFSLNYVIIVKENITDLKWNSNSVKLVLCSKSNEITLWEPGKPLHIKLTQLGMEKNVSIQKCCWRPFSARGTFQIILLSAHFMYILQQLL